MRGAGATNMCLCCAVPEVRPDRMLPALSDCTCTGYVSADDIPGEYISSDKCVMLGPAEWCGEISVCGAKNFWPGCAGGLVDRICWLPLSELLSTVVSSRISDCISDVCIPRVNCVRMRPFVVPAGCRRLQANGHFSRTKGQCVTFGSSHVWRRRPL